MVFTVKEKKLILRILKKERRKIFFSRGNDYEVKQIISKLEQNLRNVKVNETTPNKL